MTDVTIVVVPRERFSFSRQSLESIYANTSIPFKLVYVDGGTPSALQAYLKEASRVRGFRYLRRDHFLTPNHARNIGLAEVDTKYVVFIDNDVLVAPMWLDALVDCAEETGAAVVTPLYFEGLERDPVLHMAGGECAILETNGKRVLDWKMHFAKRRLSTIDSDFKRQPTGFFEFHCVLFRTAVFEEIGPFDEALTVTREHIDVCLSVKALGHTIWLEPASRIAYVPGQRFTESDLRFYLFRWSEDSALVNIKHFEQKWQVRLSDTTIEAVRNRREGVLEMSEQQRAGLSLTVANNPMQA